MVLIADNLLFLENHSKGSIFHLLRVQELFIRLYKSMIYEAFSFFNWQITGNIINSLFMLPIEFYLTIES